MKRIIVIVTRRDGIAECQMMTTRNESYHPTLVFSEHTFKWIALCMVRRFSWTSEDRLLHIASWWEFHPSRVLFIIFSCSAWTPVNKTHLKFKLKCIWNLFFLSHIIVSKSLWSLSLLGCANKDLKLHVSEEKVFVGSRFAWVDDRSVLHTCSSSSLPRHVWHASLVQPDSEHFKCPDAPY